MCVWGFIYCIIAISLTYPFWHREAILTYKATSIMPAATLAL